MIFKYPHLLWLLTVFVPLIAYYIWKNRNADPYINVSTTQAFDGIGTSWKVKANHLLFILRLGTIGCLIVALARPVVYDSSTTSSIEGTDIALALDISGSMMTPDVEPSRMTAAKNVAACFINARENDNMALVIFAGESLSLLPLTNDRATLLGELDQVQTGMLADGTAIGDGLTSAINRILPGKATSKSIILITDGSNNAGDVAPSTAAEIARQKGIRVYTIGIGTNGSFRVRDAFGFETNMETRIDEATLREIASKTGGKYFHAKTESVLQDVFDEIDQLEKTRLDVQRHTRADEDFMPWLIAAMCCVVIEILLRNTLLRHIP